MHRYPERKLTKAKNEKVDPNQSKSSFKNLWIGKVWRATKKLGFPKLLRDIGPQTSKIGPNGQNLTERPREPNSVKSEQQHTSQQTISKISKNDDFQQK